jgi:hypothetical protein
MVWSVAFQALSRSSFKLLLFVLVMCYILCCFVLFCFVGLALLCVFVFQSFVLFGGVSCLFVRVLCLVVCQLLVLLLLCNVIPLISNISLVYKQTMRFCVFVSVQR